jgi:hypothetical protein
MTNIEESAKAKNVQVLYTLLPTESYFHPTQVPQTSDQMALLERIRQTVKNHGDSIIDMNELLATQSYHHVLAVRTNQQDVLGATDENVESLFLPVSQDNGYRHLSREGNALEGQLIGQVLMERILDK